jgi:hypothetical protein
MQQNICSSGEHPDSPDMHHNEAYGYADPVQLSMIPLIHGDKTSSDQVNHGVAVSTSHTETDPEYSCIDSPVSSKSHEVGSEFKGRTRSFGTQSLVGSQMKIQKRFSMDYSKLKHHTGTRPLDATTLEQGTTTNNTTSPVMPQKVVSKMATSPMQLTRKSQAEYSQLNLPLREGRCDTYQPQVEHNQEESCHEETPTLTALAIEEPAGSIAQEKKNSIPEVLVDQELCDDSNPPLQQSKLQQGGTNFYSSVVSLALLFQQKSSMKVCTLYCKFYSIAILSDECIYSLQVGYRGQPGHTSRKARVGQSKSVITSLLTYTVSK